MDTPTIIMLPGGDAKTHLEAAILAKLANLEIANVTKLARAIHPRDRAEAENLRRRIPTMARTGWGSARDLVDVLGALGYDVELRVTPKAGPS